MLQLFKPLPWLPLPPIGLGTHHSQEEKLMADHGKKKADLHTPEHKGPSKKKASGHLAPPFKKKDTPEDKKERDKDKSKKRSQRNAGSGGQKRK